MEKRDYLLLEIEKIGHMLQMIIGKLVGKNITSTTDREMILEETGKTIKEAIGFDLDAFLEMDNQSSLVYLSAFKGFDTNNIELLALMLETIQNDPGTIVSYTYLEKALMLYEYCSEKDKTYSFERETRILKIKNILGR
jgi:hypothetical protein